MTPPNDDYLWDKTGSDPDVERLEKLLAPLGHQPRRLPEAPAVPVSANRRWMPLVITALCVAAVAALVAWADHAVRLVGKPLNEAEPVAVVEPSWDAEVMHGTASCNGEPQDGPFELPVGEWLETDASSRVRLQVADVGVMEVDPHTRLRLLNTGTDEHRLELAKGRIEATVLAPPRFLVVETPSATAVDMGCAYTLEVTDDGSSVLDVSSGWVWLEHPDRTSMVPAGARATTIKGQGPGTPWFTDADPALPAGLARIDAGDTAPLPAVLAAARPRDSLSLVHLIDRVPADDRAAVWDRLVAVAPVVATRRDAVLALDRSAIFAVFAQASSTWWVSGPTPSGG